jgi:5'-nucleotidase
MKGGTPLCVLLVLRALVIGHFWRATSAMLRLCATNDCFVRSVALCCTGVRMEILPRVTESELPVLVLLTNDDGIYAPGLEAMETKLRQVADVVTVAPATEQSGVGHTITFLRPLICKEVFDATGQNRRRWAVEGSPADSVKIGIVELLPRRPDLIISGINGGLNAGINVLYSGTVAAAIEGAFFGIDSIAVSLEYDAHANFAAAAEMAWGVIEQLLAKKGPQPQLFNLNMPTAALTNQRGIKVVPMGGDRYGESYIKRTDPKGRTYYWATNDPPPKPGEIETDTSALAQGFVTVTPLQFDLTKRPLLDQMTAWNLKL